MAKKLPVAGAKPPAESSDREVDAFLDRLAMTPAPIHGGARGRRGRLIFALDATASRQPTWDQACHIQAEMFAAAAAVGGLDIQLVFFRGFGECKAGRWISEPGELIKRMTRVTCLGGRTQIGKVLKHTLREAGKGPVDALVFVGDAMEENIDSLCHRAGQLGLLGVPAFMFHEGHDSTAGNAFRQMAQLSGGAYARFDLGSATMLSKLLSAVAVYAAGGRAALEAAGRADKDVRLLTSQIGKK